VFTYIYSLLMEKGMLFTYIYSLLMEKDMCSHTFTLF